MIVALPGLFSYFFICSSISVVLFGNPGYLKVSQHIVLFLLSISLLICDLFVVSNYSWMSWKTSIWTKKIYVFILWKLGAKVGIPLSHLKPPEIHY